MDAIVIDGSAGEGGGQILRTSLALSMISQRAIVLNNIRAGRNKPGLLRQHLTCVRAAQTISGGEVEGASLGSMQVRFQPGAIRGGSYTFAIGSAGSTTLVLQTVLPALWHADTESHVQISGGTHNMSAPHAHFIERSFAPLVRSMGLHVAIELLSWGFFPAGQGGISATIQPKTTLATLDLDDRTAEPQGQAHAFVANIADRIAHREAKHLCDRMGLERRSAVTQNVPSAGPGNVAWLQYSTPNATNIFSGFGRKRLPAERLCDQVADEAQRWLDSGTAVEEHLADQLLIPMALAGAGSFTTTRPTDHTLTNIQVIERFLPVRFEVDQHAEGRWRVRVRGRD